MNLNYCTANLYLLLYISHLLTIYTSTLYVCLGIQENIYLLFHSASLHSDKDKLTILEFPAPKKLTTIMRCGIKLSSH